MRRATKVKDVRKPIADWEIDRAHDELVKRGLIVTTTAGDRAASVEAEEMLLQLAAIGYATLGQ